MNQELIDKHREINVDYDGWWESVFQWFEEECNSRGVNILSKHRPAIERDIVFSGFWCQGDGAAFSGSIVDMRKALGDFINDYPILQKYLEVEGFYKFTWRVSHRNNIIIDGFDIEDIALYLDEHDHPFAEIWQEELEKELDKVEPMLGDLANDLCDLLYKALRDEYDALTSDEAVWDTIVANELDKEIA